MKEELQVLKETLSDKENEYKFVKKEFDHLNYQSGVQLVQYESIRQQKQNLENEIEDKKNEILYKEKLLNEKKKECLEQKASLQISKKEISDLKNMKKKLREDLFMKDFNISQ